MDQGSLGKGKKPTWKLATPHSAMTQGLVASGFGTLPAGRALFLRFTWADNDQPAEDTSGTGAWLKALQDVAPISDADGHKPRAAAIAFTWEGLRRMGLDANTLQSFDRPFKEGMFQEDRLRRLGDRRGDAWLSTVIDGGPLWSGNTPLDAAARAAEARAFGEEELSGSSRIATEITVHALLLLYEADEKKADQWCDAAERTLQSHGVAIAHRLPLDLGATDDRRAREHFGFVDGVSQPVPYKDGVVTYGNGSDVSRDPWNGVPLGEILMGHVNSHSEIAAGPVVPVSEFGEAAGLKPHPRGEGFFDFGLDGSYMVVRELRQYVAAFWAAMDKAAAEINDETPPGGRAVDADWIASRVVGRDRDGHMLCPVGVMPSDQYGAPQNSFGFFDRDRHGHGCPLGSHVRRGNPRDGLAPDAGNKQTLLEAANSHRILRRGRKFGPDIADIRVDDGVDRGLLFICLSTDITRQFEFVQQTWILNSNFATLFDETDPLVGPSSRFTIPEKPLRRIVPVDTFVQMAGGEYFFLPSMPALKYLEML